MGLASFNRARRQKAAQEEQKVSPKEQLMAEFNAAFQKEQDEFEADLANLEPAKEEEPQEETKTKTRKSKASK